MVKVIVDLLLLKLGTGSRDCDPEWQRKETQDYRSQLYWVLDYRKGSDLPDLEEQKIEVICPFDESEKILFFFPTGRL